MISTEHSGPLQVGLSVCVCERSIVCDDGVLACDMLMKQPGTRGCSELRAKLQKLNASRNIGLGAGRNPACNPSGGAAIHAVNPRKQAISPACTQPPFTIDPKCQALRPKLEKGVMPEVKDESFLVVELDFTDRNSKNGDHMFLAPSSAPGHTDATPSVARNPRRAGPTPRSMPAPRPTTPANRTRAARPTRSSAGRGANLRATRARRRS